MQTPGEPTSSGLAPGAQTQIRALARLLLGVYVLALAVILFQPTPDIASGTVLGVDDVLVRAGLPDAWVSAYRVEFVLNALMFSPVPFLGVWVVPRLRWADWVAWTFIASAGVEITQGLFLARRSAQFVDVVANTLGGLLGAVVAAVILAVLSRPGVTRRRVG